MPQKGNWEIGNIIREVQADGIAVKEYAYLINRADGAVKKVEVSVIGNNETNTAKTETPAS
jgi:hypothetical protein